ncbi:hypothetical protein ACNKHW_24770 [Shigella flexneri]
MLERALDGAGLTCTPSDSAEILEALASTPGCAALKYPDAGK